MRTTGFRLSQEKLVGNIGFEALYFDELLELQQKPISWIEKATGLTFSKVMHDSDTYDMRRQKVPSHLRSSLRKGRSAMR